MRYVKITFWVLLVTTVFAFFNYNLPKRDIVRITGTEIIRADFSGSNRFFYAKADSGSAETANRDLRLVNAVRSNGKTIVYRNEDTGILDWPPYIKFNSSDLQAKAAELVSSSADPVWVAVTHYGWRSQFLSIYPNIIKFKIVAGPDVRLIPWMSIIIILAFAGFIFWLWRVWVQFRERKIDPLLDDATEAFEAADQRADVVKDRARGVWGRFKAWLGTWKSKPRK